MTVTGVLHCYRTVTGVLQDCYTVTGLLQECYTTVTLQKVSCEVRNGAMLWDHQTSNNNKGTFLSCVEAVAASSRKLSAEVIFSGISYCSDEAEKEQFIFTATEFLQSELECIDSLVPYCKVSLLLVPYCQVSFLLVPYCQVSFLLVPYCQVYLFYIYKLFQ